MTEKGVIRRKKKVKFQKPFMNLSLLIQNLKMMALIIKALNREHIMQIGSEP
jgi:hypothetical protein